MCDILFDSLTRVQYDVFLYFTYIHCILYLHISCRGGFHVDVVDILLDVVSTSDSSPFLEAICARVCLFLEKRSRSQ